MEEVSIKTADLKKIRFTSNNSLLVGKYHFTFPNAFLMMTWLQDMVWLTDIDDIETIPLEDRRSPHGAIVEEYRTADSKMKPKTMEEKFDEALDCFLKQGDQFYGCMVKLVYDDEPAFMMELYGMQDALSFAIEDYGEEADFTAFLANMGYWWIAKFIGDDRALAMMKKFFSHYYPIIRKKR